MAYDFAKLSEVPVAESITDNCNILVEDNGEIKRTAQSNISASQVQANWNEDDETSPAFIMNKPSNLGGGVTWFTVKDSYISRGDAYRPGETPSANEVVTAFNNGTVRINYSYFACCNTAAGKGTLINYTVSYAPSGCGASSADTYTFYYTAQGTQGSQTMIFSLT